MSSDRATAGAPGDTEGPDLSGADLAGDEAARSSSAGDETAGAEPIGTVYDIQGFSVQDGPGIRTTVFLKGCPLRCPWCHSPESQRFDIQLSWQWRKCIGTELCGLCLTCCPQDAIGLGEMAPSPASIDETAGSGRGAAAREERAGNGSGGAGRLRLIRVDWDRCDDCGLCAETCPSGALSMWGKHYTVSEVVDRVLRDHPFFERSGGGVTISGGEPLSQAAFTLALLQAFKRAGVHTALDTTGHARWNFIEKALPYVDLLLLDLKSMDGEAHRTAVGVPNDTILENARRIAAAGGKMQIRIPVIPRFNDSGENLRAVGRFAKELGEAVTIVQLLPYHAMGVPKWERIKHDGPILEAAAPSDKRIDELRAILEEYELTVQVH